MGGVFRCEAVWGIMCVDICADVWVRLCYRVSAFLGVEGAGSGARCLGSEVWVGLDVVCLGTGHGTMRVVCAGLPGGFETLPLELTIKSNFLKRWLVLRSHHGLPLLHTWPGPCGKEVPSKERDLIPGTLVRAPSPHSLAKEREKENALPEVTQHAGLCFDLTLCEPGMGL